MTIRIGLRELVFGVGVSLLIGLLLIAPFALHTALFVTRLRDNEAKWRSLDITRYQIDVASNSHEDCTAGWNRIVVEDGKVIHGENNEHRDCPKSDFKQLTVDSLFARIWEECVDHRSIRHPFPTCNVAYDATLGFPRRLDTYTFDDDGKFHPSITVDAVTTIR